MAHTLVVPLDGSATSEAAIPLAARIAGRRGQSITLVRVTPLLPPYIGDGADPYTSPQALEMMIQDAREEAESYLEGLQKELSHQGVAVNTVVRRGVPADTILDLADEFGASAIVMGTHGRGGLQRFVLGSVAQQVLDRAKVPVLLTREPRRIARGAARQFPTLRRFLVPLDGSALSEMALEFASDFAGNEGRIVLLRVVEPVVVATSADIGGGYVDESATQKLVLEAKEYLGRHARALNDDGFSASAEVRVGYISATILDVAREAASQLVVMSTHGRTGLDRWMVGSVADHVARNAVCPVFLVGARAVISHASMPSLVRDAMTHDVLTLRTTDSLMTAASKILRRQASGAPVVDEGDMIVGVLSENDLLAWHARYLGSIDLDQGPLDPGEYTRRLERDTVGSIMSRPAVTIEDTAPVSAAVQMLLERSVRRLPVTHDGKLVGVISRADVLQEMTRRPKAEPELAASI